MECLTVAEGAWIGAPASRVYGIIADYRNGHPRILPKEFQYLAVERGGVGAGTVIAFSVRSFGTTRQSRAAITEPEPGHVLVETLLDGSGVVTTFTVEAGAVAGSDVTISTVIPVRSGILGKLERWIAERYLRGIYRKELALLAGVAG